MPTPQMNHLLLRPAHAPLSFAGGLYHSIVMTNSLALWLALFVLAAIAVDVVLFDKTNLLFLAKRGFELIDWMAFWR